MAGMGRRTFLFHADASPLGGVVGADHGTPLPTVGSASLAQSGGVAERTESPEYERFGKLVNANKAQSNVTGTEDAAGWTSEVYSTVDNLVLYDTVTGEEAITAKKIVAHLRVVHPRVGYSPMVHFGESRFEDLRIMGKQVTPTVDVRRYARTVTPPEAEVGSWVDDVEMLGAAVRQCRLMTEAEGLPEWVKERYGWMRSKKERRLRGHVVCSLVHEVSGLPAGRSVTGHAFEVPGVGRLVLGELLVDQGSFALTMLRVEMGWGTEGTGDGAVEARDAAGQPGAAVSVATAHSNGRPYP